MCEQLTDAFGDEVGDYYYNSNNTVNNYLKNLETDRANNSFELANTKAAEVKRVDPEVLDIVGERTYDKSKNDVEYSKGEYTIYKYNVYDYSTTDEYENASKDERKSQKIGDLELTFEAGKGNNRGAITNDEEKWGEINDISKNRGRFDFSVTDIGERDGDFIIDKNARDGNVSKGEVNGKRTEIRIHPDLNTSKGCITFPDLGWSSENIKKANERIREKIPSATNPNERTFIHIT